MTKRISSWDLVRVAVAKNFRSGWPEGKWRLLISDGFTAVWIGKPFRTKALAEAAARAMRKRYQSLPLEHRIKVLDLIVSLLRDD